MTWPKAAMRLSQLRLALFLLIVVSVTIDMLFHVVPRGAHSSHLEDVLLAKLKPTPGRSIFFIETSNKPTPHPGVSLIFTLTVRQACSIESAALHNPNTSIFVLFVSPINHSNKVTTDPVLKAVCSYSNVQLRSLNLWTYASNTPVYSWLKEGKLFSSRHPIEQTSDLLRYLTLWRWGGTYLDMAVIVLRSMEELPPNYVGAQPSNDLKNAVLNFAHKGIGHDVAIQCLHEFQSNFDGEDWSNNGPTVITRVLELVCGTNETHLIVDSDRCMGFRVFAIPYQKWEHLIEPEYLEETLSLLNESYVTKLWNKLSKPKRVKVGSNTAYAKLAEKHCPKVYAAVGEYF